MSRAIIGVYENRRSFAQRHRAESRLSEGTKVAPPVRRERPLAQHQEDNE